MSNKLTTLSSVGDIAACHDQDKLLQTLKDCSSNVLKNLSLMAATLRRLDELGVKVEIDNALLPYVRMIANGKLSAECFLACSWDAKLLEIATGLSPELQRRVAANEPFKLLEASGKSRMVGALDMSQRQLKQAFKGGAARSEEEQLQFLESRSRAKGINSPQQLVPYSTRCQKCDGRIMPGQACAACELKGAKRVYRFDDFDDGQDLASSQAPQPRMANGAPPDRLAIDWLPEVTLDHNIFGLEMDAEIASAVASRVMLHLYRGSIELAREALEDGWRSHVEERQPLPVGEGLLDESLARVLDDVRLLNMLEEYDVCTVGELLAKSEAELLTIPNLGNAYMAKLTNLSIGLRMRAGADRDEAVA